MLQDGGLRAWFVVFGSFLVHSFAFAPTEYIFGIFEHHYQILFPDTSISSIAFVGTTGSAVTYLAGFFAGIVADRFGFRITVIVGTLLMTISLILASFSNQVWQLYITQGVLFGIGSALAYYPAIAVPSHYFTKRRGLATGIAVSGVGAGGLILAPLTHKLIEKVGIFWSLRILGLLCFIPSGCEKDTELEMGSVAKEKPSFFDAVKVFKDMQFLSLSMAELTASFAFLVPLYFMQTYAVFIGIPAEKGALILGLSNGASFAGRILLGLISDYFSNAKVLLLCSWCTAFSVLVLWTLSKSFGILMLMGLMFGFFAGGYVSLVPVAVAQSFGTKQMASTIGLMYATGGLGMLGGAPLAGFLLDITKPNISYLPVTLMSGATMTLGALCVTMWFYLDWRAHRMRRVMTADTL
ncbi:major facilitator superfamily domain-containing protein [Lobosporangium transversale]|uniref:Major facilitator superfamily domain-containing protein n=1 Tax=Lobosporangium transversale TaxID=64571 RepID=A0A1Y2G9K4_9FUNG|nr:major facilitator superfamily domain-containing protein [Lobosporangium transversale]ORZ04864.1 major facilitator superfamily domain-containing protein [Lobosporangium transversale]|eukprot:XP_021876801.1 major facilitator superfamily domain-containing protein [Lobosporangium transversale]